jgi:hypothetical protein
MLEPDEENIVGRSAVDALMNRPRVRMLGQCRAKGRRASKVSVGEFSLMGSHARINVSRVGHLEVKVSIWSCVISTGWSCVSVNSLQEHMFSVADYGGTVRDEHVRKLRTSKEWLQGLERDTVIPGRVYTRRIHPKQL